jgi:predicted phage terminase large subunit-like protein
MSAARILKDRQKEFQQLCDFVKEATAQDVKETTKGKADRIKKLQSDYNAFVKYYFPHYATADCADFQIDAANKIKKHKRLRAAFKWFRGAAKSTHIDIMIPMWLKCQESREMNVMVLVGKSKDAAKVLLSDIQIELQSNQRYISDFGIQVSTGDWADGEFTTRDGCAFFALGRGQSPRGLRKRQFRPDYIAVDDLDDDQLVENPDRVERLYRWVIEALFGIMDMGRGRFIMVGNLISKNSVMQKVCEKLDNMRKKEGHKIAHYMVSQVNALDKNGVPTWNKYTLAEITELIETLGYRSSQKELFNNPLNAGKIFRAEWIQYKKMLPLNKYDIVVCYYDPSYKSKTSNDYKAIKLWGRKGNEFHHIKAFVRQASSTAAVKWLYDLWEYYKRDHNILFYMEDVFLQDSILADFDAEGEEREYFLPIRGDKRAKPDKTMRIEAVAPYWERGAVWYNEDEKDNPDMVMGVEQTLAFEKGSSGHDDGPDADEGAIYILAKGVRQSKNKRLIGKKSRSINRY